MADDEDRERSIAALQREELALAEQQLAASNARNAELEDLRAVLAGNSSSFAERGYTPTRLTVLIDVGAVEVEFTRTVDGIVERETVRVE